MHLEYVAVVSLHEDQCSGNACKEGHRGVENQRQPKTAGCVKINLPRSKNLLVSCAIASYLTDHGRPLQWMTKDKNTFNCEEFQLSTRAGTLSSMYA